MALPSWLVTQRMRSCSDQLVLAAQSAAACWDQALHPPVAVSLQCPAMSRTCTRRLLSMAWRRAVVQSCHTIHLQTRRPPRNAMPAQLQPPLGLRAAIEMAAPASPHPAAAVSKEAVVLCNSSKQGLSVKHIPPLHLSMLMAEDQASTEVTQ